jgi:hypothetical protein
MQTIVTRLGTGRPYIQSISFPGEIIVTAIIMIIIIIIIINRSNSGTTQVRCTATRRTVYLNHTTFQ